ncbi:MAG: hypothetical protein VX772_06415 [Bacteroidota bacterium]|uniref:DUF3575 domain-containing protein n=1 Tax=Flagellimonas okinawensis TaxID=3031324 RepID=A0ABT5XIZ4_9FLAO|nr:hypothetical protein [[Muricauda] okinawensis]MDF0705792.1 hypothetical protein [[Muricauda] okinawensis]MEC8831973.1 hypothetical protein [Bacteroidota bacterium]
MKTPFKLILVPCLVVLIHFNSYGQEKVNVAATIGAPDLIGIGVRFQMRQSQIGLSYGFATINDSYDKTYIISAEYFNHFSGQSKFTNRRPWYFRGGFNYMVDEDDYYKDTYLYTSLRLGRDFNVSKKIGFTFDLGLMVELLHNEKEKQPLEVPYWFNFDWGFSSSDAKVLPALSLGLFYRI